MSRDDSNGLFGLRPVLILESSVSVAGGSGTYEDPYQITNNSFNINDGASHVNTSGVSNVVLNLVSSEASTMCINVNSSGCSNYVAFSNSHALDLSDYDDGEITIYVYLKNASGDIIASMNRSITKDTIAPTNNSVTISAGAYLTRNLTISSTGASYMCFSNTSSNASDCTTWVNYATNYVWTLSDGTGTKTVYSFFKDEAGNISSTTSTITVTSIKYFFVNEDFADTTYDTSLTISSTSTYPWTVNTDEGRFESTNQNQNSTTSSSTIVFTPDSSLNLSFDYGVSSESGWDKLTITLTGTDGTSSTLVNAISGTTTGSITNISLTSGVTYTLTLSYVKDSSNSSNSDIGYIDNLVIN